MGEGGEVKLTYDLLWLSLSLTIVVTDSDGVCQQRQSTAPIKVVLDQDRLKLCFVGLWTPAGSNRLDSHRI